jgi:hypothetical protein
LLLQPVIAESGVAALGAVLWPVPNATDVLLHTNLDRAPLSPGARQALDVAR